MIFRWRDLAPSLRAFLRRNGYMRALEAESSDPYEAVAERWFGERGKQDPQCREFAVDLILGVWKANDLNALAEVVDGPIYGMNRKDKLWEFGASSNA